MYWVHHPDPYPELSIDFYNGINKFGKACHHILAVASNVRGCKPDFFASLIYRILGFLYYRVHRIASQLSFGYLDLAECAGAKASIGNLQNFYDRVHPKAREVDFWPW